MTMKQAASPSIAICIPVRDEARNLPSLFAALDGLAHATTATAHVCLLLDGCTDESAALAAAYRARSRYRVRIGEVVGSPPNAGRARRRALELGAEAVGVQALFVGHPLAAKIADVSMYLRQPCPDAQRMQVGAAVADGVLRPLL